MVQLPIKKGTDINAQDELFSNILQTASHRNKEAIIQLLFENMVLINNWDSQERLTVQLTFRDNRLTILSLLVQYGTVFNSRYKDI